MQGGERYNSISDRLKEEFGRKTVKLGIDAGFTCPNRDGTLGYGGCAFCSEGGSGELAAHALSPGQISDSISEQIGRLSGKWPDAAYLAYFQAFTGTYAPISVLRQRYYEALSDPRISGIVISTRPDCIRDETADLLEEIDREHFMWTELGLQTIHRRIAEAMGIGYDVSCFDRTCSALASRGIRVVAHLILGLPGETRGMMLESVKHVASMPVYGVKLHLMNIVRNSRLYGMMPDYVPFSTMEEYIELVTECLEYIPEDITIHRLTGDVPRKYLVSPEWSYKKRTILNGINRRLKEMDIRQGDKCIR